jgi:hypothetical protein
VSDTVWDNGAVSFTRYWGGDKGDCVQITIQTDCGWKYQCLALTELREAIAAIEKNVDDTKDAFWHSPALMQSVWEKIAEMKSEGEKDA